MLKLQRHTISIKTSRIKKAQEFKTKTSANSDMQDLPSRYQVYQGRLLASFRDNTTYEHYGQDTRSQGGKDLKDKDLKISDQKTKSKDYDKGSRSKIAKHEGTSLQQRQRPRSKELNDKSNPIDLRKECHNELTSREIVSLKILSRTMKSNLKGKVVGGGNITHESITITNVKHVSGLAFNLIRVVKNEESLNVTFDESFPEPKSSPLIKDDKIIEAVVQNPVDPRLGTRGRNDLGGARAKISTFYLYNDINLKMKDQNLSFLIDKRWRRKAKNKANSKMLMDQGRKLDS
nr:hypothetical protein [Tanacetum cinerariifolium]